MAVCLSGTNGGSTSLIITLQYAITWFALAFGLLVVYLLYHRRPTDSSDEI